MVAYGNLGGSSGVTSYQIGEGSIQVEFKDSALYLYTNQSAGHFNIEHMKALAIAGRGLNTFINISVKHLYAAKLR